MEWPPPSSTCLTLRPETIITGHRDPETPDDDAQRVLDQSRHYIDDFDKAVTRSRPASEVVDAMMDRYGTRTPCTWQPRHSSAVSDRRSSSR
jgi:hypothetical protein